jgi:hypothetical protein
MVNCFPLRGVGRAGGPLAFWPMRLWVPAQQLADVGAVAPDEQQAHRQDAHERRRRRPRRSSW